MGPLQTFPMLDGLPTNPRSDCRRQSGATSDGALRVADKHDA